VQCGLNGYINTHALNGSARNRRTEMAVNKSLGGFKRYPDSAQMFVAFDCDDGSGDRLLQAVIHRRGDDGLFVPLSAIDWDTSDNLNGAEFPMISGETVEDAFYRLVGGDRDLYRATVALDAIA
jgi:hypothetical protein